MGSILIFTIMKYSILNDFTPEELQNLLDTSDSLAHVLRRLELSPCGGNYITLKSRIKKYNLDLSKINKNRSELYSRTCKRTHKDMKIQLQDVFDGKVEFNNSWRLLQRLFNEGYKECKCEECGITEWNGKPIVFHLHHKDGNHCNNRFENLQVLCPNCHSQTDNYCGKKKKKFKSQKVRKEKSASIKKELKPKKIKIPKESKKPKEQKVLPISREDLKRRIYNESFLSIAGEYGVSDNAIRKWCDRYHLPRKKTVIRKISPEEWEKI